MDRSEKSRKSLQARFLNLFKKGNHQSEKIDGDEYAEFTYRANKKDKKKNRVSGQLPGGHVEITDTKKPEPNEVDRQKRISLVSEDSGVSYGNINLSMNSLLTLESISETICESDEAWLDSLQVSENPRIFVDPPKEVRQFIESFAQENNVENLSWAPCTQSTGGYVVFGIDLSPEIIEQFNKSSLRQLPNIPVQIVSSDFVSQNLSGRIVDYTCNPSNQPVSWEGVKTATCQLIISAEVPHKIDRTRPALPHDRAKSRLFAITSAHLLLDNHEMLPFETEDQSYDDRPYHLRIKELREEVNKRMDRHVYALQFGTTEACQSLNLSHLPLFSYRFYQYTDVEQNSKPYMNDIAVFPIEPEKKIELKGALQQDHCRIDEMRPMSYRLLTRMLTKKVKIFAKGREGELRPMREGVPAIGYHLSFEITDGKPFEGGDSGSVIFTKAEGKKFALASLKGNRPAPQQHIYEAIILDEAIKDIQIDYPHLFQNARLYIPNFGPSPA